ncbi:MAG: PadR family transcriptional regulator [Acidimicrobiia bacterium]
MTDPALSLTEMAVLGVLAEGSSHGFAIAKALEAGSDIGRILTVRRPLVYRALDRLVELGLAEPVHTEPGSAGPQRVVHRTTRSGRSRLRRWLAQPVEHVRDMRIEFLLKVMLLHRSGSSALELAQRQMDVLGPTIEALEAVEGDHVDSWRRHNASAALAFLEELALRG